MPYFITKEAPNCSGWAVIDDAGDQFGCHKTKASAIDQAVAISLNTDEPFEGERAAIDSLNIGDYVSWDALNPEILAEIVMVEKDLAVVQIYEYEDGIFSPTDKLMVLNVFKLERIPRPELVTEKQKLADNIDQPNDHTPDSPNDVPNDQPMDQPHDELMRKADGEKVIISDIDGTLLSSSGRIDRVWEFIQSQDGMLFLVTGRPDSTRAETERELEQAGVTYSELRMNPGSTADSVDFKKSEAESLLETYDVVMAIENNPDALRAYRLLGIEAVNPSDITGSRSDEVLKKAQVLVARLASVESERMTETNEARDKWLSTAWAIKTRLEGGTAVRSIGGIEKRTDHITLEMREGSDGMTFEGYAAVFNSPSQPLPFIETIKPGAFRKSLQGRHRMMLLWNHDTSQPLASTRNGSLRMVEDDYGLKVTATLPDTQLGRDVAHMIRTGLIDAMSFGFQVKKDSWSADGSTRTLEEVAIFESSLVSYPAYEGTAGSVSVRDIDANTLADGLLRLESGEDLSPEHASAISEVVAKLTKTEEVQAADGDILALKKKKLDLLMKGI